MPIRGFGTSFSHWAGFHLEATSSPEFVEDELLVVEFPLPAFSEAKDRPLRFLEPHFLLLYPFLAAMPATTFFASDPKPDPILPSMTSIW